ncbi:MULTISPECIES: lipoprotein [Acinetobacter]|nr:MULTISPECIES: lipoprotein [Acinetobacter]QNX35616.1 lipoprotein [Acinetobacter seifertii]QNX87544.1 lipoprotein [Acinetobacter seifertii]
MRKISLLFITSLALMLSACNDDNNSDNSSPTTPPTSNCKMHCAP